jgi:hypothetical protein
VLKVALNTKNQSIIKPKPKCIYDNFYNTILPNYKILQLQDDLTYSNISEMFKIQISICNQMKGKSYGSMICCGF